MINIETLRKNPKPIEESLLRRKIDLSVSEILSLDSQRRALIQEVNGLQEQQNRANDVVTSLSGEEKKKHIEALREIATKRKSMAKNLEELEVKLRVLLLRVPNELAPEIPDGDDATSNEVIRRVGDLPTFDFPPLDHVTLGQQLGIIDIERGVKIAGTRSYVLVGDGARLETALMSYGLDFLRERGFLQLNPPVLAKEELFFGTAHFPTNREETYQVNDRDRMIYLSGTGEIPLMGYRADEILSEKDLPLQYSTCTTCFRTEVGSYGKDTQGLYRVHQFQKTEQVVLCAADKIESEKLFFQLLKNSEDFLLSLELPYRVIRYCVGDLPHRTYRAYDLESWMPSRENYGETQTCSELLDFQTRREKIRYETADGKKQFAYSLNNTLVASPRILISLLECHQQKDGSVKIPKALQPYMNGQTVLTARA